MNEFLQEMFSRTAVVGSGAGLLVFGATLWAFPFSFKKVMTARRTYAAQLRAVGEEEKAAIFEVETTSLVRRGRLTGHILVGAGVAVLAVEFLFRS